jgi:hypothetical protein
MRRCKDNIKLDLRELCMSLDLLCPVAGFVINVAETLGHTYQNVRC